jgi:uncharacterized protein (DUF2062 family)
MRALVKSLAGTVGLAVAKAVVDYAMERYAEERSTKRRERENSEAGRR